MSRHCRGTPDHLFGVHARLLRSTLPDIAFGFTPPGAPVHARLPGPGARLSPRVHNGGRLGNSTAARAACLDGGTWQTELALAAAPGARWAARAGPRPSLRGRALLSFNPCSGSEWARHLRPPASPSPSTPPLRLTTIHHPPPQLPRALPVCSSGGGPAGTHAPSTAVHTPAVTVVPRRRRRRLRPPMLAPP
ncbi:MAG: hypothetical protein J3K34DRAFT_402782 [Monoraphidium minutum]|nr:MAG: hypothetical protein J3K34DRAFT_402782 [Monoraphidium minutum]